MIEVAPYFNTVGSERFKKFLDQPFNPNILARNNSVEDSTTILFDGWKYKNMLSWYKFTNDDGHILEFYADYYIVKKKNNNDKSYTLSLPPTINDFINDMNRLDIRLYWSDWIDINFEPKEYLHKNKIYDYFINLLGRMGKSNELT